MVSSSKPRSASPSKQKSPAKTASPNGHVFQDLMLPKDGIPDALYLRSFNSKGADQPVRIENQNIILKRQHRLDGNTYFNACFLAYWRKFTRIEKIGVRLEFSGSLLAKLVAIDESGRKQVLAEQEYKKTKSNQRVNLWIKENSRVARELKHFGRIFFELDAYSDCEISQIGFITNVVPDAQVSLSVGICTYNRETDLENSLTELCGIAKKHDALGDIFVVNHGAEFKGKSLQDALSMSRARVISQPNLGGCGGFNRTMYEAASTNQNSTHHLLMDDDIFLDARMVERALMFLRLASCEFVLGGNMIEWSNPTTLYEAGARIDPFWHIVSIGHGTNLADPRQLDRFNHFEDIGYNGWWFCIIPTRAIKQAGFSPPLFIHGDDIEYGYRLRKAGYPTVSLPGIGVHHESFNSKNIDWVKYYAMRNRLIFHALHDDVLEQMDAFYLFGFMLRSLLVHRYLEAEMLVAGVQDFLKGPAKCFAQSSDKIHVRIMEKMRHGAKAKQINSGPANCKRYQNPRIVSQSSSRLAFNFIRQFLAVSFLPHNRKPRYIFTNRQLFPNLIGREPYLLKNDGDGLRYLVVEPDRAKLWRGTLQAIWVALKYAVKKRRINNAWHRGAGKFQTREAWEKLFFRSGE